ncbi:UNVERIFIED_CONTAM: hypothetical protein FKN15_062391 [Acipenser sinensis]
MGHAAAFLQVPWMQAAEPRQSVFWMQAMAPHPQKFPASPEFMEEIRSSWDRPASAPSVLKQATQLASLEGEEKLGLAGFLLVDSTIAALVKAPPVERLARDPACPNPQCRVTETYLKHYCTVLCIILNKGTPNKFNAMAMLVKKNYFKEVSLQQIAHPTSTIVRPASLQVPSVLLSSSDANVVIQQALPSPTSSTVITQVPSANRPIVPISGSFPVLLQLPNGQTMPVAIPATIANTSVHMPTTIPLVTVVPNVPGIPGPSSPQPVQSEAKMRLKAALTQQQHLQITNGEIQPEEACLQSLQQPATSTTETPASPAQPPQHTQSTGRRRRRGMSDDPDEKRQRHLMSDDPDEKRQRFLERNRAAATRCRQKRKVWVQSLEKKAEDMSSVNGQLQVRLNILLGTK